MYLSFIDAVTLLKAAVSAVLDDDGFTRIQSLPAQNARKSATELLQWCGNPENHGVLRVFAADLLHLFEQVLKTRSTIKSQQKKRENIWRAFHNLRTSKSYVAKWVQFLQRSTSLSPCPIFYQFVSDRAFKELMKAHFIVEQSPANVCIQELSYGEENALRYAAGYIPRALRRKLERSSHPLKRKS